MRRQSPVPRPARKIAKAEPRQQEAMRPADEKPEHRLPMGQWLVQNMPQGANPDSSADRKSRREVPFGEETGPSTQGAHPGEETL